MAKASIVIVGTGWAGYTISQKLDDKKFNITVISPEEVIIPVYTSRYLFY
jgi:NADH:ubiquinone reductase (non-electrogenic)